MLVFLAMIYSPFYNVDLTSISKVPFMYAKDFQRIRSGVSLNPSVHTHSTQQNIAGNVLEDLKKR